jgi:hypothetical protein
MRGAALAESGMAPAVTALKTDNEAFNSRS